MTTKAGSTVQRNETLLTAPPLEGPGYKATVYTDNVFSLSLSLQSYVVVIGFSSEHIPSGRSRISKRGV